jgi:hypothetical protein
VVTAPGRAERRYSVTLAQAERREIEVAAGDVVAPPQAASAPASARPPIERDAGVPSAPGWSTQRWLAVGLGGVGGSALLVGIVAGLVAGSKHGTLTGECDASNNCPWGAQGDLDSFHTWRTFSTVGYVFGAIGIVGGAVLWFTATPPKSATTAGVWVGPTSAGVGGSF